MTIEQYADIAARTAEATLFGRARDYKRIYMQAARKQNEIDIDKACDAHCLMCSLFRPAHKALCVLNDEQCDELKQFIKSIQE